MLERQSATEFEALRRSVAGAGAPDRLEIAVLLDDLLLGDLGNGRTDSRLVSAIAIRGGAINGWLSDRLVDEANIERAFPGSSWR